MRQLQEVVERALFPFSTIYGSTSQPCHVLFDVHVSHVHSQSGIIIDLQTFK